MSALIYIVNSTRVFASVQFITLTYFDSLLFSIYWYFIVSKLYVGTKQKNPQEVNLEKRNDFSERYFNDYLEYKT